MLMSYAFKNFNFTNDALDICLISDSLFLQDFDCDQLATRQVLSKFDIAKGSFSKVFEQAVLISDHL